MLTQDILLSAVFDNASLKVTGMRCCFLLPFQNLAYKYEITRQHPLAK